MAELVHKLNFRATTDAELEENHKLIEYLIHLHGTKARLNGDKRPTVKCTILKVPGHEAAELRSWKFDEFAYGKLEKPLPTNARGLFSFTNLTGRHEIVIRGYDKFFNTEEVPSTKWSRIEQETSGPYHLTLKQNGCIIFIGVLPDRTLLVTSKHSLGSRDDIGESHAERGRKWLSRHLRVAGRTEAELIDVLLQANITAVCELCDDDFEEHILAYPPEKSGLYLHGLNHNTTRFETCGITEVNQFAEAFGLRSLEYINCADIPAMRRLLDNCSKTGTYQGSEVEGFVIRTKIGDHDFFFKHKFEEPYLLFRQWREVTKALIAGHEPKFRQHQAITIDYLKFISPVVKDPVTAQRYNENHGIISLRQQFLDHRGGDLSEIIAASKDKPVLNTSGLINWTTDRFVLVPIATIGCGKTTVAVALKELFSFGHVQNDNILAKKPALQFATNIQQAFESLPTRVVVADRNNHMCHERASLVKDIRALQKFIAPPLHFIALSFIQSKDLRSFTAERVLTRGDNHQSIRAATMSEGEIRSIMNGFHQRFQELNINKTPDDAFADVIEIDPLNGSRTNLQSVIQYLFVKGVIASLPTPQDVDRAFATALAYTPEVYKHMTSHPSAAKHSSKSQTNKNDTKSVLSEEAKKERQINYVGLRVLDCQQFVKQVKDTIARNAQTLSFWTLLASRSRIQPEFHITLIHESDRLARPDIWAHYVSEDTRVLGMRKLIVLKEILHDDRVMAIHVDINGIGLPISNKHPHITIGTSDSTVKPFESNAMLEKKKSAGEAGHTLDLTVECEVTAYYR